MANQKLMAKTKLTSFGMSYRMRWTESKIWKGFPIISIFETTENTAELDNTKLYEIKEKFAQWYGTDPDIYRIKVLNGKVIIYETEKVGHVQINDKDLVSWKYLVKFN